MSLTKPYQNSYSTSFLNESKINDNCKVCVRVRPPLLREIEDGRLISTVNI